MTDIEIPDNEDAACALDNAVLVLGKICWFEVAERVSGAARRLRADAEEIARLETALATAKTEAAAQRELATLLERESSDPLTRIAAALERPSREWVAALGFVACKFQHTMSECAHESLDAADELLAEMGEG